MSATSIDRGAERRNKELARIHVGKKHLGLDEETYRALLERVAGKRSAADLDGPGRAAVLREMGRLGFKVESAADRKRKFAGRPREVGARPMLRKVEALLADARRPWGYAHAMAKSMFTVTRVEWLRDDQLHKLVAALQTDALRHGRGG